MNSIRIQHQERLRIIRDVRANTDTEFEAFYRGYHIVIVEMGELGMSTRQRFSLDVSAADGTLIVDTWHYADEYNRDALLTIALDNIFTGEK